MLKEALEYKPIVAPQAPLHPDYYGYTANMSLGVRDKIRYLLPLLTQLTFTTPDQSISLLSVGAADASVEKALKQALPHLSIIATDFDPHMARQLSRDSQLLAAQAEAASLPVAANSINVVTMSSLLHELASVEEGPAHYGNYTDQSLTEALRILKPDGYLYIREFVQTPNPDQLVVITLGHSTKNNLMQPAEFAQRFLADFTAATGTSADSVQQRGTTLTMPAWLAQEFAIHYSWRSHFDYEIKQRYAYLTLAQLTEKITALAAAQEITTEVTYAKGYVQPEYATHVLDGLQFTDLEGNPWWFEQMTGVLIVKKMASRQSNLYQQISVAEKDIPY